MVLFQRQRWAGSADDDINFFLVGGKNCSWQLHEGHDGRLAGLGSKIGPKPPPRNHWKALINGFRLVQ
jgi:hypothetical protein